MGFMLRNNSSMRKTLSRTEYYWKYFGHDFVIGQRLNSLAEYKMPSLLSTDFKKKFQNALLTIFDALRSRTI